MKALADKGLLRVLLPGHGPVLPDPAAGAGVLHRAPGRTAGPGPGGAGRRRPDPGQIVTRVYTDIDPGVRPAAELSVQAQLDYLGPDRGELAPASPVASGRA